jgi:predicted DNA-binding transcriptional regulator YafY
MLHAAINQKRKIRFMYFDYDLSRKKVYRGDSRTVTPYALTWSEEKYYLVCYYDKHPNELTHFRVDKMESIEILDEKADKLNEDFNLSEYMKRTFSMFHGDTKMVKLHFCNSLLNVVYDRFGYNAKAMKADKNSFTVKVEAAISPQFYGWLFGFGNKVKVIEPTAIRNGYKEYIAEVLKIYDE